LQEFRKPEAGAFFAPCGGPASAAAAAYQCQALDVPLDWRHFTDEAR
jgi:hypothetical protein